MFIPKVPSLNLDSLKKGFPLSSLHGVGFRAAKTEELEKGRISPEGGVIYKGTKKC